MRIKNPKARRDVPVLPKLATTLRAEVLAVLLASQDMTGVESLFEHSRMNLATVVRALIRKYHWPIERRDFPVNIGDGRAGWASTWCLPQDVIDAALQNGGREWLEGLRAIRAVRAGKVGRRFGTTDARDVAAPED